MGQRVWRGRLAVLPYVLSADFLRAELPHAGLAGVADPD